MMVLNVYSDDRLANCSDVYSCDLYLVAQLDDGCEQVAVKGFVVSFSEIIRLQLEPIVRLA